MNDYSMTAAATSYEDAAEKLRAALYFLNDRLDSTDRHRLRAFLYKAREELKQAQMSLRQAQAEDPKGDM